MSLFSRRAIFASCAALAIWPIVGQAAPKPPNILFVCQAGTAKSAIARELFRKRAKARGIAVTAFSRGLHIEDHVLPLLRQKLATEGIDTSRDGFMVLTAADVGTADILVAFTPIPGTQSRNLQDWSDVPSVNDRYPEARADLDRRIEALLDTIEASVKRR